MRARPFGNPGSPTHPARLAPIPLACLALLIASAPTPAAAQPRLAVSAEGTWAFDPPVDRFGDDALLDLRSMNEPVAGQSGFVRLADDGMSFVRGEGQPIRFWSVCSYGYRLPHDQMEHHARQLAKLGVNMVRLHTNIAGTDDGQAITDVDADEIDRIKRFVKACKDQGVYLTISPYWYHHDMPASWEPALEGWKAGERPTGSLFFNPTFQRAYKSWVRELYATPNPYTGVPIAQDPAVAILQVKNEDSLLFWSAQSLPRPQQMILARQYARWLIEKHGSLEAAFDAWDDRRIEDGAVNALNGVGDDPDRGVVGMYNIWEMTQTRRGAFDRRLTDQLQFLATRQRRFYQDIASYLRDELGCRQLTNAMNWKSADKLRLDDAERWSYAGLDVIAVNRYTGGIHEGENDGYRIDPGHHIVNRSVLRRPLELPTNLKQVVGYPMIITESTWVRPNLYQSEGPLLIAAYQSLTGVDSLYWFEQDERDWLRDPRRTFWHVRRDSDAGYALDKWSCATHPLQGMFPANAVLFRRGYLEQGEPVVVESRPPDHLWRRRVPAIAETETFDPNRDLRDLRGGGSGTDVSRLAFLVGPVHVAFDADRHRLDVADLSSFIDADRRVVRSNTGQLTLDWGRGLLLVDAPAAQAAAGFLRDADGRFELSDLTVESDNHYACVQAVSLDGRPLREAARVLVQVGTTARLDGWTTEPATFEHGDQPVDGRRIVLTGKPPYRVADTRATITLANPVLREAVLLDPAGYPVRSLEVERTGDALRVPLPPEAMYVIFR